MPIQKIDGLMLKEMFLSGAALVEKNRANIDALNVFPVPDGDTGSNMSKTLSAAAKELSGRSFPTVSELSATIARGALKGARGNSGVILSQIFRGMARALEGVEEMDGAHLAKALRLAADTANKAIMKPKEGTILTVARVIAEEVEKRAAETDDLLLLMQTLIASGDAILKRTPDMLPVLKQAGVVDSGGKGLMVFYAGFYSALIGKPVDHETEEPEAALPGEYVDDHTTLEEITFAYCTEMIVARPKPGMKDADVARIRARIERLGDCVLVVSDLEVVKIHVHTNDPGKVIQLALELGEIDNIKIENMLEQFRERQKAKEADAAKAKKEAEKPFGIVAVALGDGIADVFRDLGVDLVVDGGQTMNPSIEDLSGAIEKVNAREVFVLPNNSNIILAARQAAEMLDQTVRVIPTKSVPMGVAAAIAFQKTVDGEENERAMTEAAEQVHTASVTYAVRDTVFDGREIHEGDVMGLLDNKITALGKDVNEVAERVLESMVTDDSAMITIFYGQDVSEEQANALRDALAAKYDLCDVESKKGGQPLYYYFISVE